MESSLGFNSALRPKNQVILMGTWNEGGSRLIAWVSDEGDDGEAEGLCNCLTLRYPLQWITLYPAVVRPALRLASTHFILEIDRYYS